MRFYTQQHPYDCGIDLHARSMSLCLLDHKGARDRLRGRHHLMRERAQLLAPIQNTHSPSHLPEIGKKIAYKAPRDGGAERFAEPSGQKSIEVALIDPYDPLLTELELYRPGP